MLQSQRRSRPRLSHAGNFLNGFTLIELMVVIAIIGLVAAMLFPVFGRVREGARRSSCQSNLKQIGMALIQYSQDYDEKQVADWFGPDPGATEAEGTVNGRYKWCDAIYPYLNTKQVFTCPSDNTDLYVNYSELTAGQTTTSYGSYVINHSYRGCATTAGCVGSSVVEPWTPPVSHPILDEIVNLSSVAAPERTVWVMDAVGNFCFGPSSGTFDVDDESPRQLDNAVERHLATTDVLWCDGHVKAVNLDTLAARDATGSFMPAFTIQDD